jgi:glycosyltransferase involved in cell wall biosynthesis
MDRVRFLGWRDDQAALIEAADFVVVPSRHEPLSNVTLEAWSLGKPVIATASEGPSWLIEDGSTGLLTPVDDDAALAAGLRRMADDPALRARLGAAGHAVWAERFSADAVCAAYLATLRRLVEARGARP